MLRKGSPPEARVQVSLENAWVKTPLVVAKVSGSPEQSLSRTRTRSWKSSGSDPAALSNSPLGPLPHPPRSSPNVALLFFIDSIYLLFYVFGQYGN